MTRADPFVRRAVGDDIEGIAALRIRSWQAAYRGLLPDTFLDELVSDPVRLAQHRESIEARRDVATWVAIDGAGVVGFCTAGVCRDAEPPTTAEIWAIYLDPPSWRRGLGSRLFDAAVDWLRVEAFTDVVLWMLDGNERAESFYVARGCWADGARRDIDLGSGFVPELRYRMSLEAQ